MTTGLFFDANRRMQKVFDQIPILKKSERIFLILFVIYALEFLITTVCLIFSLVKPNVNYFGRLSPHDELTVWSISQLLFLLFLSALNLMIGWIVLKYNQPLMTRTDLKTGKNVSMLFFIRSKINMRKIFDPETDHQSEEVAHQQDDG